MSKCLVWAETCPDEECMFRKWGNCPLETEKQKWMLY